MDHQRHFLNNICCSEIVWKKTSQLHFLIQTIIIDDITTYNYTCYERHVVSQHTFISMPKAAKECLIFCPNVTAVKWAILIWCNNLHTRQTRRCYLPFLKRKEFLFCPPRRRPKLFPFFFLVKGKGRHFVL